MARASPDRRDADAALLMLQRASQEVRSARRPPTAALALHAVAASVVPQVRHSFCSLRCGVAPTVRTRHAVMPTLASFRGGSSSAAWAHEAACATECGQIGQQCLNGEDCCSGACYNRQCGAGAHTAKFRPEPAPALQLCMQPARMTEWRAQCSEWFTSEAARQCVQRFARRKRVAATSGRPSAAPACAA